MGEAYILSAKLKSSTQAPQAPQAPQADFEEQNFNIEQYLSKLNYHIVNGSKLKNDCAELLSNLLKEIPQNVTLKTETKRLAEIFTELRKIDAIPKQFIDDDPFSPGADTTRQTDVILDCFGDDLFNLLENKKPDYKKTITLVLWKLNNSYHDFLSEIESLPTEEKSQSKAKLYEKWRLYFYEIAPIFYHCPDRVTTVFEGLSQQVATKDGSHDPFRHALTQLIQKCRAHLFEMSVRFPKDPHLASTMKFYTEELSEELSITPLIHDSNEIYQDYALGLSKNKVEKNDMKNLAKSILSNADYKNFKIELALHEDSLKNSKQTLGKELVRIGNYLKNSAIFHIIEFQKDDDHFYNNLLKNLWSKEDCLRISLIDFKKALKEIYLRGNPVLLIGIITKLNTPTQKELISSLIKAKFKKEDTPANLVLYIVNLLEGNARDDTFKLSFNFQKALEWLKINGSDLDEDALLYDLSTKILLKSGYILESMSSID